MLKTLTAKLKVMTHLGEDDGRFWIPGCHRATDSVDSPRYPASALDDALLVIGARAFDLLLCLIEQHERVADKETLMQRVWPGRWPATTT